MKSSPCLAEMWPYSVLDYVYNCVAIILEGCHSYISLTHFSGWYSTGSRWIWWWLDERHSSHWPRGRIHWLHPSYTISVNGWCTIYWILISLHSLVSRQRLFPALTDWILSCQFCDSRHFPDLQTQVSRSNYKTRVCCTTYVDACIVHANKQEGNCS